MIDLPSASVDLPQIAFPFTVEYLDDADWSRVLHTDVVTGPGALRVTTARELGVDRVRIRLTYPDGVTEEA